MFKNLIIFTIPTSTNLANLTDEAASKCQFQPCSLSAQKSLGWVPPRGQAFGPLIERVNGHWFMDMVTEVRKVPGEALNRVLEEKCKLIEQGTGRKPGRKEKRELKEELLNALLPQVLPTRSRTQLWIDPEAGLLMIDATGGSKVDDVLTLLVKTFHDFVAEPLQTATAPSTAIATWLLDSVVAEEPVDPLGGFPQSFSAGKFLELKACDESMATVRFSKHQIVTQEVVEHLRQGKLPEKIALEWDDRVSFVLSRNHGIQKLAFEDTVFQTKDKSGDAFDADAFIMTGELSKMLPELIVALGGLPVQATEAAHA